MDMKRQGFRGTNQFPCSRLLIAFIGMAVFLQSAEHLLLQGNGRKNQCICGKENHQAGKDADHTAKPFSAFVSNNIYFDRFCQRMLHLAPPF